MISAMCDPWPRMERFRQGMGSNTQGSKTPTSPDSSRSCTPSAASHFRSGIRRHQHAPNGSLLLLESQSLWFIPWVAKYDETWIKHGKAVGTSLVNIKRCLAFMCMFRRSGIDLSSTRILPYRLPSTCDPSFVHPLAIKRGNQKFQFFLEGLHGYTERWLYCCAPCRTACQIQGLYLHKKSNSTRQVRNGHIKRLTDSDIQSSVLDGSRGCCPGLLERWPEVLKWPSLTWVSIVFHKF